MSTVRLPRKLTDRYHDLLRERGQAANRIEQLDFEMAALSYALRVLNPEWEPPAKAQKQQRAARFPVGELARECLAALRNLGDLWTPEVVAEVVRRRRVRFADRKAELDFASAVAMSLRRYEKQGFLEIVDRDKRTQAFKWRIKPAAAQGGGLHEGAQKAGTPE